MNSSFSDFPFFTESDCYQFIILVMNLYTQIFPPLEGNSASSLTSDAAIVLARKFWAGKIVQPSSEDTDSRFVRNMFYAYLGLSESGFLPASQTTSRMVYAHKLASTFDFLCGLFQEQPLGIRQDFFRLLDSQPDLDLIFLFCLLLTIKDIAVRAGIISALADCNRSRSIFLLTQILKDDMNDLCLRQASLNILIFKFLSQDLYFADFFSPLLLERDWYARYCAITILSWLKDPDAEPLLLHCLSDDNRLVRIQAIKVLGEIKSSNAVDSLVDLLKPGDKKVQLPILEALEKIGDSRTLPSILQCLTDDQTNLSDKHVSCLLRLGSAYFDRLGQKVHPNLAAPIISFLLHETATIRDKLLKVCLILLM